MSNILDVARPQVQPSNFSKPFWDGTREKKLLMQYCPRSRTYQFYPRPLSIFAARRDLLWREVSGHGRLYSYTVARMGPGVFRDHVPYVVALVELDEGVRIISNLVQATLDEIQIGMEVVLVWIPMPDGTNLPLFEPKELKSPTSR
jgi:uncharacterized protein